MTYIRSSHSPRRPTDPLGVVVPFTPRRSRTAEERWKRVEDAIAAGMILVCPHGVYGEDPAPGEECDVKN